VNECPEFEKIYYSNVIGLKKPYPETFLQVCEWNKLIPSETLFIDDSLQHVEGARRAGLRAYHLQPGERVSELLSQL
jgi:putative hydrolase of the HAD superfamily